MDLLITLEVDADAEDLTGSLHRHLRQDGRGWEVAPPDHTDTVRVLVPGRSALQLLAGSVLQWLSERRAVRSVALTTPDGQRIVVTAQDTPQPPPEPVYPPQEPADEDDEGYADTLLPSDEHTGAHSRHRPPAGATPPGPVIDPDDDWPRDR
ncbi:hypothetical protein H9Y04_34945 [Streptomyces sp. TRM66268-LWL]|uniref:Uncharacterized protein n=1 Tax=Streptomyces polyasparticus TaxID=2767826 RepID=A0ABR7SQG3_9ACTN|nr:hypothetical protein [Streptomyces polyasparticus]MBC9717742.1 hypothetical protein [Streptomyces polyasparticus]